MMQRLWLALVALAAAAVSVLAVALRRGVMRVEVAGESMTPALEPGDFLILRRGAPPLGAEYGHIVALQDPRPEGDGRLLLKRVVGLPGEALRVGGSLQVNGRVLIEPYAHGDTPTEQHRGINRLEPGTYFVLGDHRGGSTDSRDFGPIPRAAIAGHAVLRYWPFERAGLLKPPERRLLGIGPEPTPPTGAQPLQWHPTSPDAGNP
ncbi:MAG: signal peptidase I [Dehalococcoidia bacterium]|nr:MAG: signal peptidase I [Dehalococcoidia bacterium]